MTTDADAATRIQRVFRRYRAQRIAQTNAAQNTAAIKIQAVFRGVVERKLLRAAKRLARELSAKEPLQRALKTHMFRRRLRKAVQGNVLKRIVLEGLRSHPTAKKLSEATAFLHNGKKFSATFKKVYTLQTADGTSKVDKLPHRQHVSPFLQGRPRKDSPVCHAIGNQNPRFAGNHLTASGTVRHASIQGKWMLCCHCCGRCAAIDAKQQFQLR
jgi:hypothetical protein